jgi:integrase
MKFSDVALLKLSRQPAPDKDQEITGTAGRTTLSIRRRAGTGKISFQIRYRYAGKPRRLALGAWPRMNVVAAARAAKRAQGIIAGGADPGAQRRGEREAREQEARAELFAELANAYTGHLHRKGVRTADEIERIIKADLTPFIGKKKVRDVKQSDVFEAVRRVRDRGSDVAANRIFATLAAMLNFAVSRGDIDSNICQRIRRRDILVPEAPRQRVLDDAEIESIWKYDDAPVDLRFHTIMKLLLLCAVRCGELRKAEWEEFDLESAVWKIPAGHTKTNREHVVYLAPQAVELFRLLKEDADAVESRFVLPSFAVKEDRPLSYEGILWGCRNIWRALGIEGVRLHDLRRTHRTLLGRLKVPWNIAEMALGHAAPAIVEVYDTGSHEEELRAAAERLADEVTRIAAGVIDIRSRRRA